MIGERSDLVAEDGIGDFHGVFDEGGFLRPSADGMVKEFVQVHGLAAIECGGDFNRERRERHERSQRLAKRIIIALRNIV